MGGKEGWEKGVDEGVEEGVVDDDIVGMTERVIDEMEVGIFVGDTDGITDGGTLDKPME